MDDNMIADIRRFNRRYTNTLGVLNSHVLDSGYSFAEARVVVEIGMIEPCIANTLAGSLNIDRSYMSRIINRLVKLQILSRQPSSEDQRVSLIHLTEKGKQLYSELNDKSDEQIIRLFQALPEQELIQLHTSMIEIEQKLDQLEQMHNDTI